MSSPSILIQELSAWRKAEAGRRSELDVPLEPFTSTLAIMGNFAPRACANFFTSALLPGS